MSVFLAHRQLPTIDEWQRALDGAGLPLQLDAGVTLNHFMGFLPVRYRGQESGFDFPFDTDTFDTCVTLVARSALESCTAVVAAAALAALTGGVVHDDADGQAYWASDATAWARRIVALDGGS